jgi:hypothetical protein
LYDQKFWSISEYKSLINKQIWIKLYILDYPLYGDLQNNSNLGHVDFFFNPLDIINNIIFIYLLSNSSKRIFIKINLWAQESQLDCSLGEYSQCDSNKIGTSSTFLFIMFVFFLITNYGKFCQIFKTKILKKQKIYISKS